MIRDSTGTLTRLSVIDQGIEHDLPLSAGTGTAAAAFILLAAAARAGIVASGLAHGGFCIGRAHDLHQLLDRFAGFDDLGKLLKVGLAVAEE